MGGASWEFQTLPFCLSSAPCICVHEVTKASSSNVSPEVSPVFGRYGGCSSDQKDDKRIPSNNTGVAVLTWFHHRLEERSQTNSQDRISGFSDHLTENDDLIATVEGQVTQP